MSSRTALRDAAAGTVPAPLRHRNLALLLLQAREAVMARFRPILTRHGVTEQQWRIIRGLLEAGALEPRQICTLCGISSPSLAGVLARMDELGLVTRTRLETDLRRVLVDVTPKSRALARRMAPLIEQTYQVLEDELGADFVARVYAVADELVERLDAPHARRRKGTRPAISGVASAGAG